MTAVAKSDVRIVHAGDLSTRDAMALEWIVGVTSHRFQEIAICGDKVIGSWRYEPTLERRSWRLESEYTEVAKRFQRRGIAVKLWQHGVARWRPVVAIKAIIGTDEGLSFLARIRAELAYSHPELWLNVKVDASQEESWKQQTEWCAQSKLRELGKAVATTKQKLLPAATALKACP